MCLCVAGWFRYVSLCCRLIVSFCCRLVQICVLVLQVDCVLVLQVGSDVLQVDSDVSECYRMV